MYSRRWTEIGFSGVKREGDTPEGNGERQRGDFFHGTNDDEHGPREPKERRGIEREERLAKILTASRQ